MISGRILFSTTSNPTTPREVFYHGTIERRLHHRPVRRPHLGHQCQCPGVIQTALASPQITRVLGAAHGIKGVLADKLYDMGQEDPAQLDLLQYTPLLRPGSCRYKLADPDQDDTDYRRILEIFQKYDVRYFFYNGGNDSMDTCNKISKYMQKVGYPCNIIGVPKTIDNDLSGTDHCPGYGSAAKYIATILKEVICDSSVYDLRSVTVAEIMGRHTGWLAAAASLAAGPDCNGPDLILLPECPFDEEAFLKRVAELEKERHNVIIAVSEGVKNKDGVFLCDLVSTAGQLDAFGHKAILSGTSRYLADLIRVRLGCKTRAIEFSTLQRCASHLASRTDVTEAYQGRRRSGGGRHARRDRQDGRHQAPERPALPRRDRDGRCDEGREL